jgi:hypothetical protein
MPEIARQMGRAMREFRRVQQHLRSELRDVVAEFDAPASSSSGGDEVPTLAPRDDTPSPGSSGPTEGLTNSSGNGTAGPGEPDPA